jgi:hypothetical protein
MKNKNPDFPVELKCQKPYQVKKGKYIYCYSTDANLEVLSVFENGFTYIGVLGVTAPTNYFGAFRDDKETLYAVERYEGGFELINARGESA